MTAKCVLICRSSTGAHQHDGGELKLPLLSRSEISQDDYRTIFAETLNNLFEWDNKVVIMHLHTADLCQNKSRPNLMNSVVRQVAVRHCNSPQRGEGLELLDQSNRQEDAEEMLTSWNKRTIRHLITVKASSLRVFWGSLLLSVCVFTAWLQVLI